MNWWRTITACFILVAFLLQHFGAYYVVAAYYFNTSAYSMNCENKARPMMHCNGKCQMMKKLQKASDSDKKDIPRNINPKTDPLILLSDSYTAGEYRLFIHLHMMAPAESAIQQPSTGIFHPPRV